MEFIPLYYKDKIHVINKTGDVGIITLWSPTETIYTKLVKLGVDTNPDTSRIAAIGTLYGNGVTELLRNLLYNPQIHHLIILGKDLGGSRDIIKNFFLLGTEEIEYLGVSMLRIKETSKIVDKSIDSSMFNNSITDVDYRNVNESLNHTIKDLPYVETSLNRVEVQVQEVVVSRYPSDPRAHTFSGSTPLSAWKELVFRVTKFGYRVSLKKGTRIELQNVKVIVDPTADKEDKLEEYGFSSSSIAVYQAQILNPDLVQDQSYSYGNRIREYFGKNGLKLDWLEVALRKLKEDPEARDTYLSLWDSHTDSAPLSKGHPCLVSLYFRKFDNKLTLTATFRTHNVLDGWLNNVYGLMSIQQYVSTPLGMGNGPITVISHSVSIDPAGGGLSRVKLVADSRIHHQVNSDEKSVLTQDPCGNFVITTDQETREVVVQHFFDGQVLNEYRGKKAIHIEKKLADDCVVSDISHALYLGRKLAQAEAKFDK